MAWWFYVVAVPAAVLLIDGIPHFVRGLSGEQFPSPFSGGPGTKDTAVHNVLWGGGNLIVGGVLLWLIRDGLGEPVLLVELVVVALLMATATAYMFSHPERFGRRRR